MYRFGNIKDCFKYIPWFVPDWFYGKKKKIAYEESAWLMQGQTETSKTKKTKTNQKQEKKER